CGRIARSAQRKGGECRRRARLVIRNVRTEAGIEAAANGPGMGQERPGNGGRAGDRYSILGPSLVVGVTGFEPATLPSRTARATKLRHTPVMPRRSGPPRRDFISPRG